MRRLLEVDEALAGHFGSVGDAGEDVLSLQAGVFGEEFFDAGPGGEEVED